MFETIKRSFMSPFSSVLIVARAIYMGTPLTTAEHFIVGLWWRLVVRAAVPLLSFVLMTPVVSNGTVQPPFWLVFLALFYQTPQFTLLVIFTYLWWVAGKSSRGVGNRLGGRRQ
ncbi:hypothetical protein BJ741DRAFT_634292 [Chytriomyces cf. hyalinus JEL632]|nr:hypothetical protein BJ741DRAFT_634292 [Chytriomyces cf. hyalinus JEL632]